MKRNTLTTAVLAGLTGVAGMAGVANAVNVNPDGLGQVLLFPYYTARGGNNTLISIVNTTERGKAVKIRFIEAMNSREVLDFNIYMSPFDVWTTAIVPTEAGGAKIETNDTTCTVPYIFGDFGGEQAFLTFELDDGGPSGAERTASGYIEVIEMGTMLPVPDSAPLASSPSIIPWVTKHVNGVPRNCNIPVLAWTEGSGLPWIEGNTTFGFDTDIGASGGLFGSGSIINVNEGTMLTYNATAVDGFWARGTTRHTQPDSLLPDLAAGNVTESFVFDNGRLQQNQWTAGVFALNATLTLDRLMNEYVTDPDLNARTEWVLTFPTKRFHTDAEGGYVTPNNPIAPFTNTWHRLAGGGLNLPCETMEFRFWDREESEPARELGPPIVSPPPPPTARPTFQLCKEANVVRIGSDAPGQTEILKEPARDGAFARLGFLNIPLPYEDGWVRFDLSDIPGAGRRVSVAATTGTDGRVFVEGLPVIGFQASTVTNGQLAGGVLSNYGGTFNHRGTRSFISS